MYIEIGFVNIHTCSLFTSTCSSVNLSLSVIVLLILIDASKFYFKTNSGNMYLVCKLLREKITVCNRMPFILSRQYTSITSTSRFTVVHEI